MSEHKEAPIEDADLSAARDAAAARLAGAGLSLDEAALWVEPSGDLEDSIMAAIADEPIARVVPLRRRPLRWLVPAAAVAAAAVAFAVVARPAPADWTVALGPAESFPAASATVSGWNEPSGTRVQVDIDGLDAAPDGFVYELWFSNGDVHISAGTFHSTGSDVTLWAGVDRRQFPRVWITLEAIDEDESPGTNVLDSDLAQT